MFNYHSEQVRNATLAHRVWMASVINALELTKDTEAAKKERILVELDAIMGGKKE